MGAARFHFMAVRSTTCIAEDPRMNGGTSGRKMSGSHRTELSVGGSKGVVKPSHRGFGFFDTAVIMCIKTSAAAGFDDKETMIYRCSWHWADGDRSNACTRWHGKSFTPPDTCTCTRARFPSIKDTNEALKKKHLFKQTNKQQCPAE